MFAGFNMQLHENMLSHNTDIDTVVFRADENVQKSIEDYLLKDGSLDVASLRNDWFPDVDADIFLSHSHKDEDLVKNFAGYLLHEFGITSFIDSMVWGYADDLIEKLYRRNGQNNANKNASLVYILLQSALAQMIDHCECVLFINTPNSIRFSECLNTSVTDSIWIYNELLMSRTIRKRSLEEHRKNKIICHGDMGLTIPLDLSEFPNIDVEDFKKAKSTVMYSDIGTDILYELYKMKSVIALP